MEFSPDLSRLELGSRTQSEGKTSLPISTGDGDLPAQSFHQTFH